MPPASTPRSLELLVVHGEAGPLLAAPGVGWFSEAVARGRVLTPGMDAGVLVTLGRPARLLVPDGVAGAVRSEPPEAVHAPVGYGDVLYELEGLEALGGTDAATGSGAEATGGGLAFGAPQTGRFWHRPAPDEPAMIEVGRELVTGDAVGLIEVMKTFAQVVYRPSGGLPTRARVVRILAADGGEVGRGAPLFEVEPA